MKSQQKIIKLVTRPGLYHRRQAEICQKGVFEWGRYEVSLKYTNSLREVFTLLSEILVRYFDTTTKNNTTSPDSSVVFLAKENIFAVNFYVLHFSTSKILIGFALKVVKKLVISIVLYDGFGML